jgi:hypothetical protein
MVFLNGANSFIRSDLEPGEIILWHARPNPWVAMDRPLIAIVAATGVGVPSLLLLFSGSGQGILLGLLLPLLCLVVTIRSVIAVINIWFAGYALTSRGLIVKAGMGRARVIPAGSIANLWSSSESIGSLTIEYRPMAANAAALPSSVPRDARNGIEHFTLLAIQAPVMVEALVRRTLLARFPTTGGEA